MVNYSLVLRSVNTNLIEINQAKARIKAAKAQGTTPKTEDTDLVKTEQQKVFAVAQYAEVMDLSKFSKHISTHGCVYGHADINAMPTSTPCSTSPWTTSVRSSWRARRFAWVRSATSTSPSPAMAWLMPAPSPLRTSPT